MTAGFGRVIAQLAEPDEDIPAELIDLINSNVQPSARISAADVYVRAMYVVSDQVNSFGGRFPLEEHPTVARLLIDSPVLVGHRKDKLPVGRNFHAVMVERNQRPWVKSYFYWLRSSDQAEQLRDNIDGGIYKECSVAFTFQLPECSICGCDIRKCTHQLFESYERNGIPEKCCFNYRRIEKVLETSLVYRGAVPDTLVSKDLEESVKNHLTPVDSIGRIPASDRYLIVPRYDGLPLTAHVTDGQLVMTSIDGARINMPERHYRPRAFRPESPVYGILVGYRGKERCSLAQLKEHLNGTTGEVSRLVLNVFPHQGVVTVPSASSKSRLEVRVIPYRFVEHGEIDRATREIMTRDGVEIWPEREVTMLAHSPESTGYLYCPHNSPARTIRTCEISLDGDRALLCLGSSSNGRRNVGQAPVFELIAFDPVALAAGRRFVARRRESFGSKGKREAVMSGRLVRLENRAEAWWFECSGTLNGRFVLRPIRLRGEDCYLFSQIKAIAAGGSSR